MKKKRQKRDVVASLKAEIKKNKAAFAVYVVLRLIVIVAIVISLLRGRYENVFSCVLALILFLVPAFFRKNFGIELPDVMEILIMLFIFSSIVLGEISCFYVKIPIWDTVLHTVNGFLCAAIGFSLVDILNRNNRFKFNLSPLYLSIVAFCFSMTIGVLWEMFEFGADMILSTDMQKDFVINKISTVTLDSTLSNTPVVIEGITETAVNGEKLGIGGYLDIGLIDTMKDLIVNFLGAVVFSIIGFFYVKSRGKNKFAKNFIPVVETPSESQKSGEIAVGDSEKCE